MKEPEQNVEIEVLLSRLVKTDIQLPISQKEYYKRKDGWDSLLARQLISKQTYEDRVLGLQRLVLDNDTLQQFKKAVNKIEESP